MIDFPRAETTILVAPTGSTTSRMLIDMKEAEWVCLTCRTSFAPGLKEKLT